MWIQTVNKSDVERVWVNATNTSGATVTAHWPAFKFTMPNVSVSANEITATGNQIQSNSNHGLGHFVGLAYEDIADGAIGVLQVYGYHESFVPIGIGGATSILPGTAVGPLDSVSLGLGSVAIGVTDNYGPVIAMSTVGTANSASLWPSYADHCFIRAL